MRDLASTTPNRSRENNRIEIDQQGAVMEAVGQISETRFVHRVYQESHVRISLIAFSSDTDPDVIVGNAVEVRVGDPKVGTCETNGHVFGASHDQFRLASEIYKRKVTDYVTKGILK